ncbi:MAG: hypothetical protein EOP07_15240 [Proteobacteria bacterium]|nr:MAG: hypothetical protein EOP07_15240 [Pseudomonadota bacterium]
MGLKIFLILAFAIITQKLEAAPSLIFPFAVNWEILRSGFNNTLDVALEADTYGEEWTLEIRPDEGIFLRTPRATTAVIGIKSSDDPEDLAPFDLLVIKEEELARLLGITEEAAGALGKEVFLEFRSDGPEEQTFTFKANPKYFVSASLKLTL